MNSSNSILLIDPAFNPKMAPACKLLVKAGLDSFSYAIINIERNKIAAFFDEQECENVVEKLAERIKTDPYLALPFSETKVAFYTENTVTIPTELYNEDEIAAHTQFFTAGSTENLYVQPHDLYKFTTIFSLSPSADKLFEREIKRYQQDAVLLKLSEKTNGTTLLLDFTVGAVNVLFLKDGQVILQQCYETENPEEFNYYLILMINELNIDQKETSVKLTGIIHEDDDKYNCLAKYFNNIEFLSYKSGLDQQILEDMPAYYYSSLLALNECEL